MTPTPHGRYVVIDGRRWRPTDTEGEKAARALVQQAKIALGERGTPWWEQTIDERRTRWEGGS